MGPIYGLLATVSLIALIKPADGRTFGPQIENLLVEYDSEFNRVLLSSIPESFEIVYPKQIRRNSLVGISTKEHKIRYHGIHEHFKHVTLQIDFAGRKYKIKLELNEALLSSGIIIKHFKDENQPVISQTVEHCYYHGTVKRDEWSSVAVSTCNGIRGVIQMHNETYIIQPLLGGDEGMNHPHVVFRASKSKHEKCGNSQGHWRPFHELHKGEFVRRLKFLRAMRLQQPEQETEKILRLALVVDNSVCQGLNTSLMDMASYLIETANIIDLYYRELKVRLSLVYLEYWNVFNRMVVSPVLRQTLHNFMEFKDNSLAAVEHDIAQFITTVDLEDHSVGIAVPDSVCTGRAVGISQNPNIYELQQTATILAHMIGHNLGIKHDEDGGCDCSDLFGCIMSVDVLHSPGLHSRMFSSCSLKDLQVTMDMGLGACLAGSKQNNQGHFTQICGNNYVERGEECDCGTREECTLTDPCCDPDTCLLKPWAQCRLGPCCRNCTVLPSTHMCRPSLTECDVPEFCGNMNGECPPNNYIQDGHHCANNSAYCFGGVCPTPKKQCQSIWGEDAMQGDDQCFERFNPTGNFNGHCGTDMMTGTFAKCQPEDVHCGLLHCEGGSRVPSFGPDKAFSKTTVFSNGIEYECKIVHGPASLELPHFGLMQDGTKCAEGRVCMGAKCILVDTMAAMTCPLSALNVMCSNNGVCTKSGLCFCNPGWTGIACNIKMDITTTTILMTTERITPWRDRYKILLRNRTVQQIPVLTTTTVIPQLNPVMAKAGAGLTTMWLIIILASVVGLLILILAFTMFCYRRKSPRKWNKRNKKEKKSPSKSCKTASVASRLISFGSLPSYKSDKIFGQKKQKGKKRPASEESDIGELPPPPIIITSPNSSKPPEKGILKNMLRLIPDSVQHSSDTNTDDNLDVSSSGQNTYDDDDYENEAEIREILGEEEGDRDDCDNLNRLPESNSFDFVLSPPSFAGHPVYSPFQPRLSSLNCEHQRPLLFTSNPQSPPKSRIIRMKNLDELMKQIDKHTIDLSPSPEDPLLGRLSPSNSEDLRSSETEADRYYQQSLAPSVDTDSKVNDTASEDLWDGSSRKSDSETSGLCTVTPMSPLELRSLLNFAYGAGYRKSNDTLLDSQFGDTSSQTGASISRAAYDKSSGYGSEHDPERFSIDEAPLSRSNSNSPPNYSAVIRTGPNQIQLVSASQLQQHGFCGDDKQLHQLLEGLPRINAGSFERSPVTVPEKFMVLPNCPPGPLPNPRSLHDQSAMDNGSAPCIDRSLEEIPQQDDPIASQSKKNSHAIMKGKRPLSLGILNKHNSPNKDKESSPSCMGGISSETKRYSALAKTASVDM